MMSPSFTALPAGFAAFTPFAGTVTQRGVKMWGWSCHNLAMARCFLEPDSWWQSAVEGCV